MGHGGEGCNCGASWAGINDPKDEMRCPIQNKSEQTLTTYFRRVVRIYDWLIYGHEKTPKSPKGTEAG